MYDVVVKKFTFAISFPGEFLIICVVPAIVAAVIERGNQIVSDDKL